jgi:hypothetical protein
MPAVKDRAKWAVAGVRKPPKNEPAGEVRGGAARSAMGIWVARKVCATIAMRLRASNGAPGGRLKQVLMVEVAVERSDRRFTLMLGQRI